MKKIFIYYLFLIFTSLSYGFSFKQLEMVKIPATGSGGQIVIVSSTNKVFSDTTGAGVPQSVNLTVASGHTIFVAAKTFNVSSSCSDNFGNTYSKFSMSNGLAGTGYKLNCFVATNVNAGLTTITVTDVSGGGQQGRIVAIELSGGTDFANSAGVLDVFGSGAVSVTLNTVYPTQFLSANLWQCDDSYALTLTGGISPNQVVSSTDVICPFLGVSVFTNSYAAGTYTLTQASDSNKPKAYFGVAFR